MFIKSIRWRLQLWLAFLLVSVLTGFGITAYQLHRNNRFEQIDEELGFRVAALSRDLRGRAPFGRPRGGRPPFDRMMDGFPEPSSDHLLDRSPDHPPDHRSEGFTDRRSMPGFLPPRGFPELRFDPREFNPSPNVQSLFSEPQASAFYYVLWSPGGTYFRASTNAPPAVPIPAQAELETRMQTRIRDGFREGFQLNGLGECILVGRSIGPDLAALRIFALWLIAAGGAVLALGLGGGWMLTSRAIRPVEDISAAARRIADGNLSERISVTETDSELGRLAGVLNSTFARLDAAFSQQKQFTADASHELRTPIAVIIAEAQTTLARERSAAEYRETVETCLDAAQQMRRLTQSLLELARFDAGQEPLATQPFSLSDRLTSCVELVRPLAAQRHIAINASLGNLTVQGDPDRLGQVFVNLLTNAIYYNRDEGRIEVTVREEGAIAVVTVSDTGQGIASDDLPHIFKRFFRADKSRSQAVGRCGLGLAICKAIIDAHGGSIEVNSQPDVGTTFAVRLPR